MPKSPGLIGALVPGTVRFTDFILEGVKHSTAAKPKTENGEQVWWSRGEGLRVAQSWNFHLDKPTYRLRLILTSASGGDEIYFRASVNPDSYETRWGLLVNNGKEANQEQVTRLLQGCLERAYVPLGRPSLFERVQQGDGPVSIPNEVAWDLARKLNTLLWSWTPAQF